MPAASVATVGTRDAPDVLLKPPPLAEPPSSRQPAPSHTLR